jgi:hypothetical protein
MSGIPYTKQAIPTSLRGLLPENEILFLNIDLQYPTLLELDTSTHTYSEYKEYYDYDP